MAIEFVEHHWLTVKVKGNTGRLLAREPNALEGARYMAATCNLLTRTQKSI